MEGLNTAIELKSINVLAITVIAPYIALGFDGALPAVQGDPIAGVTNRRIPVGDAISVVAYGETYITSSAAFSPGDKLMVTATGKFMTGAVLLEVECAVAIDEAFGADEIVRARIYKNGLQDSHI